MKVLPSEQARALRETRPSITPPQTPPATRLRPGQLAEQRSFHARAADDVQELKGGLKLPDLPPPPPPLQPPPPPPAAQVETALQSNPNYQRLTTEQRQQLLDVAGASWSQGSTGGFGGPPRPPGPDPTLLQLLSDGKLTETDSQGHSLLQNLETLRTQALAPGLDNGDVLRSTLGGLGAPPGQFSGPAQPLAQQKPAEYARLMAELTSPAGEARLPNGETLRRPTGPMGGPVSPSFMLSMSLQEVAGNHRGAIPQPERQEAIRTQLQGNAPAWSAFQALPPEQQGRFLELADSSQFKDQLYLNGALGLQGGAGADPNLVGLLAGGRLTEADTQGRSLMENLLNLKNQQFGPGFQPDMVMSDALMALNGPGFPAGLPGPGTNAEQALARQHPSEYIRLLAGLTGPQGQATLPDGQVLRRPVPPPSPFGLPSFQTARQTMVDSLEHATLDPAVGRERRTQALREQFGSEPAFTGLTSEQQQQFLSVADGATARPAELAHLLGLEGPPQNENLLKLLRDGTLSRPDVLANLGSMATQAYAPGLDAGKVLEQTLQDLADPYSIRQGNRGTCTVTSLQFILAQNDPAEYARLVAGVTSTEGRVGMRGGHELVRAPGSLEPDDSQRPDVSRILQSSLMDYGDGDLDYVNRGQGEHVTRGTNTPRDGAGLYADEWNRVASQVLPYPTVPRYPGPETAAELATALAQGPTVVALRWPSPSSPNGGHMLTLERIEDGQVYLRNPWGANDLGGGGLDGTPQREVVPGGGGGRIRMTLEEFNRFLTAYAVPAPVSLADFVRDLADHLALGSDLPYEEIFESLSRARERLAEMEEGYADEEPPIADLMMESLQLFDSAFARLLAGEDLALAVVEAEEADDLLELVAYEISCAQEFQAHQLA